MGRFFGIPDAAAKEDDGEPDPDRREHDDAAADREHARVRLAAPRRRPSTGRVGAQDGCAPRFLLFLPLGIGGKGSDVILAARGGKG